MEFTQFSDEIRALADNADKGKANNYDETQTIYAVVNKFIDSLGYDLADHSDVIPEFTADVGIKHGEKVDFAIINKNKPVMLIEVKSATTRLTAMHQSQLHRYFNTKPEIKICLLTNGDDAWFFSDFTINNVMDSTPFLKMKFTDIKQADLDFLYMLRKQDFNAKTILAQAEKMKVFALAEEYMRNEIVNPNDNFIRFVGKELQLQRLSTIEYEALKESIPQIFRKLCEERRQDV